MPHSKLLVVRAASEAALSCRVFASTDAAGYPVHLIKRLFEGEQVRARLENRPVRVRVVEKAQRAEVLDLSFTLVLRQVPATSRYIETTTLAPMSLLRLFLVLLNGSLHGWRLGTNSAPERNSADPPGVKKGPWIGSVLGNRAQ